MSGARSDTLTNSSDKNEMFIGSKACAVRLLMRKRPKLDAATGGWEARSS
jgi:hypothetical protein